MASLNRLIGVYRRFSFGKKPVVNPFAKFKPRENEAELDADQRIVRSMSDEYYVRHTYKLCKATALTPVILHAIKLAQEDISRRIEYLPASDLVNLLKNFVFLNKSQSSPTTLDTIKILMDKLMTLECRISGSDLFFIAYSVKDLYDRNIEYESFYKSQLLKYTPSILLTMDIGKLLSLLETITKLTLTNQDFYVEYTDHKTILSAIEHAITLRIAKKDYDINTLFTILKSSVSLDRGDEDFFRLLEGLVFPNTSLLTNKNLITVPSWYDKRILHDYSYILNNIYKPVYHEFYARFEKMDPESVCNFLQNYWHRSSYYGMYCDDSLEEKLTSYLQILPQNSAVSDVDKIKLASHILAYLVHARRTSVEVTDAVYRIAKPVMHSSNDLILANLAMNIAKCPEATSEFWIDMKEVAPKLYSNPLLHGVMYSTQLCLKLQSPHNFEYIKEEISPFMAIATENWVKRRALDLKGSKSASLTHRAIQKRLTELGYEFKSEFFDEYHIDLAIPSQKICIEVLGPGHYLYPSKLMNGRTQMKKRNLEKKGWIYHGISYAQQRNDNKWVNNLVNSIVPLRY